MVAAPIGIPGCPEFAFCTASIESIRIVLMHSSSSPPDVRIGSRSAATELRIGHQLSATVAMLWAQRRDSRTGRVPGL